MKPAPMTANVRTKSSAASQPLWLIATPVASIRMTAVTANSREAVLDMFVSPRHNVGLFGQA